MDRGPAMESFLFWTKELIFIYRHKHIEIEGFLCSNCRPTATVRTMWTGAWTPILPQALFDQRLSDFMSL